MFSVKEQGLETKKLRKLLAKEEEEKKKGKTTTVHRKGVRNHYEKKKLTQRETHTPPATPPARRDLQMLRNSRVGGFTPSSAAIAEAVRDRFCT